MTLTIRDATQDDLEDFLALGETRRVALSAWKPIFWKFVPDALEKHRPWIAHLIGQDDHGVFVAEDDGEIVGTVVARPTFAPPIFDPGGIAYTFDDFAVASPDLWDSVGRALIDHARGWCRENGGSQIIVIGVDQDDIQAAMLAQTDLSIASTWWTAPA